MLQFSEVQGQHRVGMGSTANLWQGVFPRRPAQLRSPSTVIYHKDNILHCPQCSCDKQRHRARGLIKTVLWKVIFLRGLLGRPLGLQCQTPPQLL